MQFAREPRSASAILAYETLAPASRYSNSSAKKVS
jgi:hypothetical protein